jgi:hypothetical protein
MKVNLSFVALRADGCPDVGSGVESLKTRLRVY